MENAVRPLVFDLVGKKSGRPAPFAKPPADCPEAKGCCAPEGKVKINGNPARHWGALALELHHAAVEAALRHQFRRGALLGHMAVFQHHDMVGPPATVRIRWAMTRHRLAPEQAGEGGLDGAFVLHVQAGGGLVQQHHRRVPSAAPGRMEIRCRSPPERVEPFSPITVW